MADVVCRCGTYIRAYVAPGTKVTCSECGEVITMRPAQNENDAGSAGSTGDLSHRSGLIRRKILSLLKMMLMLIVAVAVAATGAVGYRLWSQRNTLLDAKPVVDAAAVDTTPSPNPVSDYLPFWSATLSWTMSIDAIPQGAEILRASEELAKSGMRMNSPDFWRRLDGLGVAKNADTKKLIEYLESIPIDSFSTSSNTASSDWAVLGIHQNEKELGVLVRYYHEPLLAEIAQSGEWIKACRGILNLDEFLQATTDLFENSTLPAGTLPATQQAVASAESQREPDMQTSFLAPRFGYLVLLFDIESGDPTFQDVVSIPGDVAISGASISDILTTQTSLDKSVNRFLDPLGDYKSSSDRPLARILYSGNNFEKPYVLSEIRRFIKSMTTDRCRRLAEIAEAVTLDQSALESKVSRFRKEFPYDIGAEVLAISIWSSNQQGKRSNDSYEEVGRVMIEAAQRLYLKTADPLLLEIKSRIYSSYGRRPEADKCLLEAEQANYKSLYLLEHRIEESIQSKNKELLISYLSQLNELVRSKPISTISQAKLASWTKTLNEWRSVPQ